MTQPDFDDAGLFLALLGAANMPPEAQMEPEEFATALLLADCTIA